MEQQTYLGRHVESQTNQNSGIANRHTGVQSKPMFQDRRREDKNHRVAIDNHYDCSPPHSSVYPLFHDL